MSQNKILELNELDNLDKILELNEKEKVTGQIYKIINLETKKYYIGTSSKSS